MGFNKELFIAELIDLLSKLSIQDADVEYMFEEIEAFITSHKLYAEECS